MNTETNVETAETPETKIKVISVQGDKATVMDARDRTIIVKKLSALAFYDLARALPDDAKASVVDLATLAASVCQVNTSVMTPVNKEADIRFVLKVLDFDGLAAVSEGLRQLSLTTTKEIETAKN